MLTVPVCPATLKHVGGAVASPTFLRSGRSGRFRGCSPCLQNQSLAHSGALWLTEFVLLQKMVGGPFYTGRGCRCWRQSLLRQTPWHIPFCCPTGGGRLKMPNSRENAILQFLQELTGHQMHGFIVALQGETVAQGYWKPYKQPGSGRASASCAGGARRGNIHFPGAEGAALFPYSHSAWRCHPDAGW